MKAIRDKYGSLTELRINERDTYNWANRSGACWPCSTLSGRKIVAEFDGRGILCGLTVDNGFEDYDGYEAQCLIADFEEKAENTR